MRNSLRLLVAAMPVSCAGDLSVPENGAHSPEWDAWYSEYVLETAGPNSQSLFTVYPNGIVLSDRQASIKTRIEDDTGRHVNIRHNGDAFWSEELPLFRPDNATKKISNYEHQCQAMPTDGGYSISCTNKNNGAVLYSKFEIDFGITWFDYYCGINFDVCRYRFSKGTPIFSPKMISHLKANPGLR